MADVTKTSGYPKLIGTMGLYSVYLYKITDVDDDEELDTGLGSRAVTHTTTWTGDPGTQASGGGNSTLATGVITFNPSTDNLGADVLVYATGM